MIIRSYGGEVGISKFVIGNIGTIDLKLELVVIMENLQSRRLTGGDVLHGVVEVELLDLGSGGNRLLHLGDEHVLGLGSEHFTFISVKVGVVGENIPLVGSRRGAPSDSELDIVVLEGDERDGGLPVFTESKPEGIEPVGCTPLCTRGPGGDRPLVYQLSHQG